MKLVRSALLVLAITGNCYAEEVKITGTIEETVRLSTPNLANSSLNAPLKSIKLLKIELSNEARDNLAAKANTHTHLNDLSPSATITYPAAKELGMGAVPVLDQGAHGTCVTFATTAAIDAALKKGDYLSQLCQLQLGNYLARNGYALSGWDGSWGQTVLHQMDTFGVISLTQQQASGCAGLKQYPLNDDMGTEAAMTPEEYHALSEDISERVVWSPLLDVYQSTDPNLDTNALLNKVKDAINAGDRLAFGVLLTDLNEGVAGAVAKNKANNDSWVLTPEIIEHLKGNPEFGGHEMVITGYDDNATAKDKQGRAYKGLLHLRNSWGKNIGDKGDFYMSYDYFKMLVLEVSRIRSA